jgi:hypothetical protein
MKNSDINDNIIEKKIIPAGLREQGFDGCYLYQGSSMKPTFLPGQLLYVRTGTKGIQAGDIIVFKDPSKDSLVVHRVVSLSSTGFITRGDNNIHYDTCPVGPEQIVGRVGLVEDGGNIRVVPRGKLLLLKKRVKWGLFRAGKLMGIIFRGPYLLLKKSKICRQVLFKFFSRNIKIIQLKTPEGWLYKVMYKDRTVGRWWPKTEQFYCQKPFDLFISPKEIEKKLSQ